MNAKQKAFAEKQEQEGRRVVGWIFAILIILAAAFCVYSITMYA